MQKKDRFLYFCLILVGRLLMYRHSIGILSIAC